MVPAPVGPAVITAMTKEVRSCLHSPEFPAPRPSQRHMLTPAKQPRGRRGLGPRSFTAGSVPPALDAQATSTSNSVSFPEHLPRARALAGPQEESGRSARFTQACFPGKGMWTLREPQSPARFLEQEPPCSSRCCETLAPNVAQSSEEGRGISVYPFRGGCVSRPPSQRTRLVGGVLAGPCRR